MISVVIPVFNRPANLARAIASVERQGTIDDQDIEIIVVDDGSSPPLTIERSQRVSIVRLPKNLGPAAARNAAIKQSSGDYLAFLDSDDVWLPDKLLHQYRRFRALEARHKEALIALACGFYYPNRLTGRLETRVPLEATRLADFVSGCRHSPGSTLFIDRAAFDIVGFLDERLRRLEDFDWFVRFGLSNGQLHVDPWVGVIIAPSNRASSEIVGCCAEIIRNKFALGGEMPLAQGNYRRLLAYLELERGTFALSDGQKLKAFEHLLRSFLLHPRFHVAVKRTGGRSTKDVPEEIASIYQQMGA